MNGEGGGDGNELELFSLPVLCDCAGGCGGVALLDTRGGFLSLVTIQKIQKNYS